MEDFNGMVEQMEFKSLQWFGATVRSHGSSILVRAESWHEFGKAHKQLVDRGNPDHLQMVTILQERFKRIPEF